MRHARGRALGLGCMAWNDSRPGPCFRYFFYAFRKRGIPETLDTYSGEYSRLHVGDPGSIPDNIIDFGLGPIWLSTPMRDAIEDPQERHWMFVAGSHVRHPHPNGFLVRVVILYFVHYVENVYSIRFNKYSISLKTLLLLVQTPNGSHPTHANGSVLKSHDCVGHAWGCRRRV